MRLVWMATYDGKQHAYDVDIKSRRFVEGQLCAGDAVFKPVAKDGQPKCFRCIIEETLWNEKLNANGPGKHVQTESATHGERPS